MLQILRMSWRNLWRNYRRTVITLMAISSSTTILVVAYSLMAGLMEHAVSSATNLVVGEAQIHSPGYLTDRSLYKTIDEWQKVRDYGNGLGVGMAPRSYGYGLVAAGSKSAGALFWGIDPQAERSIFDLSRHLEKGEFLPAIPEQSIVIGAKLARSLNVSIGDEVVAVVQGADGSLGNELYRVSGILKAAGDKIDRNAVLLHQKDFSTLFVAGNLIHELALNSRGRLTLEQIEKGLQPVLGSLEIKTWRDLLPMLSDMMNVFEVAVWIFGSIFFLVGILGVLNTMLMATFERMREFGILKALGTSPAKIVFDVLSEAFLMGVLATTIGAIVGLGFTIFFYHHGIDTSSFAGQTTIAGVAFDPIWKTAFRAQAFLMPIGAMWVSCLIAALYPALLAARLDPVKAIHHH